MPVLARDAAAQKLAQTGTGAKGALLFHSSSSPRSSAADGRRRPAKLFLYPSPRHLFADTSLPDYDDTAAALLLERVFRFLDDVEELHSAPPVASSSLRSSFYRPDARLSGESQVH